jgi:hypothetical protein
MARRRYTLTVRCGYEGCCEYGHYEPENRDHYIDLEKRYGQRRWRCVRHAKPEEVLSPTNLRRQHEIVSEHSYYEGKSIGLYWNHFGMVSGPGFKAYAKDFPEGTKIIVTAEIVLP